MSEAMKCQRTKTIYPVAKVKIALDGKEYIRHVAVAADLPEDVLLKVDMALGKHIVLKLSTEEQQEALKVLTFRVQQRTRQPKQTNLSELGQTYV